MKLQKTLSVLLAAALLCGLLWAPALAAETETAELDSTIITVANVVRKVSETFRFDGDAREITLYIVRNEGFAVEYTAKPGYNYYTAGMTEEARGTCAAYSMTEYLWNAEAKDFSRVSGDAYTLEAPVAWSAGAYEAGADIALAVYDGRFGIFYESEYAQVAPSEPAVSDEPAVPVESAAPVITTMQVDSRRGLNVRTGPGAEYKKAGPALSNNTTVQIVETQGEWGRLANGTGWVYLPGLKAASTSAAPAVPAAPATPAVKTMRVDTRQGLNVRTGPGTEYKKAGSALSSGTVIRVAEIRGEWGRLANGAGWVYLPYTRKISG